jgi:hypothetical protein
MKLQHRFVELMPSELEDGVLYVSIEYCTAIHKCPCGCGNRVVTPIAPTDWQIAFNGETISLNPSIGNWSLKCQSHYWIIENRIVFAKKWTKKQILSGREKEKSEKKKYFQKKKKNLNS